MAEESQAVLLNQRIEKDVRMLIGDLHMQLIVQRALFDLSQQPPASQPSPEIRTNGATPPQPEVRS